MRQLQPVNLVAPGFRGLNLAQSGALLDASYATIALNCVIDDAGRLASRAGYSDITSTDIVGDPAFKTLFEYQKADGTLEDIIAYDGGISNSETDPLAGDISGAVTDADGRWWMQNFRDIVIGFQAGQRPIVYNGAGNFAPVVENSGTAPIGSVGLAAYGRIWGVDADGKTIKYSALLDETKWDTVDGAGSIDMTSVWTMGTDIITGIVAFNGSLVVFGKKHIVFWNDGTGSELGINPENIYVNDIVAGTGCVTQWSIQAVGETDLLYLSYNGVQSLTRVLESSSNPVRTISQNVRAQLLRTVKTITDKDTIRSVYSPINGFYLLTIPEQPAPLVNGITYCHDTRYPFTDEKTGNKLNIITTWTLAPTAWVSKENDDLTLGGTWGVGTYDTDTSDGGVTFQFSYQSPWIAFGQELADRIKILKRIGSILFVQNSTEITYKWFLDFDENANTLSKVVESDSLSEFNVAEYSIGEFSGGLSLRIIKIPARGKGQYYRLGIEATVDGVFALQQLELFTKIGRLA